MSGFGIAELPVAVGWLTPSPLPGAGGAYGADLAEVEAWAPDMVVSLTTGAEMAAQRRRAEGR